MIQSVIKKYPNPQKAPLFLYDCDPYKLYDEGN